jgi:hypothetical protein
MKTLKLGVVSLLSLSASLAAGCRQEVESTDIRTSGVYPVVDVLAEGTGSSHVSVKLKVGGPVSNTYLDLTGDDTLSATANGETRTLDSSGSVSYAATFATEASLEYTIAFLRGQADTNAPATTVTLPAPFTITLEPREISRATADLTFTWSTSGPSGGNLEESVSGSCIDTILETIPDDGSATISRDQLHVRDGQSGDSCTVTVTLARVQTGQVDPAFTEGGNVQARQVRAATFTSTP